MITVTQKVHIATHNRRKRILREAPASAPATQGRIPRVSRLMALAIRFEQMLRDGAVRDMSELARLAHVTQPRMTQIMNLRHLAPDIQEELLHLPLVEAGDDPITERDLRPITRMRDWQKQRRVWLAVRSAADANHFH